jgi:hypothetical protein
MQTKTDTTNANPPVDIGILASQATKKNLFADMAALKLSDTILSTGAKETLSKLPVRKPTKQEFFRCHRSDDMSLITAIYEDKETREFFLIAPEMRGAMLALDQLTPVKLVLAITRQNVLIMVPAKLPSDTGSSSGWQESLLMATERAKETWTRTAADMSLGAYRVWEAIGNLSDPTWPDMSLNEMMALAFRDRVIDTEDHPVFNKLLGRI